MRGCVTMLKLYVDSSSQEHNTGTYRHRDIVIIGFAARARLRVVLECPHRYPTSTKEPRARRLVCASYQCGSQLGTLYAAFRPHADI